MSGRIPAAPAPGADAPAAPTGQDQAGGQKGQPGGRLHHQLRRDARLVRRPRPRRTLAFASAPARCAPHALGAAARSGARSGVRLRQGRARCDAARAEPVAPLHRYGNGTLTMLMCAAPAARSDVKEGFPGELRVQLCRTKTSALNAGGTVPIANAGAQHACAAPCAAPTPRATLRCCVPLPHTRACRRLAPPRQHAACPRQLNNQKR